MPISAQQTAGFTIAPLPYCTPAPAAVEAKCNLAAGKCTCEVVYPAPESPSSAAASYAWSIAGSQSNSATSTVLLPADSLCAATNPFSVVCSAQLLGTASKSGGAPLPSAWVDSAPTTLSNLPPTYAAPVAVVGQLVEGTTLLCNAPTGGFADDHNAPASCLPLLSTPHCGYCSMKWPPRRIRVPSRPLSPTPTKCNRRRRPTRAAYRPSTQSGLTYKAPLGRASSAAGRAKPSSKSPPPAPRTGAQDGTR
jgi:hypothetical protein